jgi:hypothetical protein
MLYLRSVRNHSPFRPESFDLTKVVAGLTDGEGGRASFYRMTDPGLADRVATILAMFGKERPEHVSYVLIGAEIFEKFGLSISPTKSDIEHALLHETHCEIDGLQPPEIKEDLAREIESRGGCTGKRLHPKPDSLGKLACYELDHQETGAQAAALIAGKPKWREIVDAARTLLGNQQ